MSMTIQDPSHYKRSPRRKAEFYVPPNMLKAKVGSGGLSEQILDKAQHQLENNNVDFRPVGEMYLDALGKGVDQARKPSRPMENEKMISGMLYPAMQLKANGGMFHYPLITSISDKLIQFLEVIDEPDQEALDIVVAYQTTMRAILLTQLTGDGGLRGAELTQALVAACYRYFEKNPRAETPVAF